MPEVCPYLKKVERGFVCTAINARVYPGLEKCLADWWVCRHAKGGGKG